jgi:hypothetical protein
MKEEIQKDIETIQTLIEELTPEHAIEVRVYLRDKKTQQIIEKTYHWNNNDFLKSALQSELRGLKLELLNL